MTLPLTPAVLAAAYEYLRATSPFKGWRLPHCDEVEFSVTRHRDRMADHTTYCYTLDHVIRASTYHIKTTNDLIEAVADTPTTVHNSFSASGPSSPASCRPVTLANES